MQSSHSYLLFSIAQRRYALPLSQVDRVVRAVEITPVRDMPAMVRGVINVAGAIVPVLDVRVALDGEPREVRPQDHFILTRAGHESLALLADTVQDVAHLEAIPVSLDSLDSGPDDVDLGDPGEPETDIAHPGVGTVAGPRSGADVDAPGNTPTVATLDGDIVRIHDVRCFLRALAASPALRENEALNTAVPDMATLAALSDPDETANPEGPE